jgi:hypothetical protein
LNQAQVNRNFIQQKKLLYSSKAALAVLLLALNSYTASSQGKIQIPNGSFEGTPGIGSEPKYWKSCGTNSTADIMPGPWGVKQLPKDGDSYLGLTAREDKTYETISCKLPSALQKDSCYTFKVNLCRASSYAGYNGIGILRIWGGNKYCDKQQLLAVSGPVSNFDWKNYALSFISKDNYDYISIECYYKMPSLFPYRANILIDALLFFEICARA